MDEKLTTTLMEKVLRDGLGLDLTDPNLTDTPSRISKMYCREFFSGLNPENEPKITIFPNEENYDEMIMLDNIPFTSVCSHHFLPFQGFAWFLYIPDKNLIGASKINRIINYFASRPQLQEKLSQQIVNYFVEKVHPLGCMLIMRATHGCMTCRGIKQNSSGGMTTSKVYGSFVQPTTRQEGLELIKLSRR